MSGDVQHVGIIFCEHYTLNLQTGKKDQVCSDKPKKKEKRKIWFEIYSRGFVLLQSAGLRTTSSLDDGWNMTTFNTTGLYKELTICCGFIAHLRNLLYKIN